jgi:predicted regulator of Ras-like GTPase activity (Roadblock/LC7/MglB family)
MTSPQGPDSARPVAPGTTVELSADAKKFNWLLDSFTSGTVGVVEAIAVSSDGLIMAMSAIRDRDNADRLAAVVSAVTSLAGGASTWYAMGTLNRVIIDMAEGYLLVTSMSTGSALGVLADRTANLGTLGYQMTVFANRAADVLTPRLIVELKNSVQP